MPKTAPKRRWVYRVVGLCVVALAIAAGSWVVARLRSPASTPDLAAAYFEHATYRTNASTDQVVGNLQGHLRTADTDWRAYSMLGLAYLQKARETGDPLYYSKAEAALGKALQLEPEDYTAVSAMGALALARHQFAAALEWGTRARQINSDKSYAYGVITDAQVELGRYVQAVATLQQMSDLRPDANSYARISYLRELHGDLEGALDMMQRAVDSSGNYTENRAWARTQLAQLYWEVGDLDRAESEYQLALETLPGYMHALAGLGRVRAAQGRGAEAISLLKQATAAAPLPEFVITLGDLYRKAGNEREAQTQYALVRAIQQLYQGNGVDLDMEMALFNADHGIDPLGTVTQARQAYSRRPSIHAADVLAWALYQAGGYREAQTYSEQALRLGTQDALKLFHAGMIAYRLGDRHKARTYLTQALSTNPHFSILYAEEAQALLKDLGP